MRGHTKHGAMMVNKNLSIFTFWLLNNHILYHHLLLIFIPNMETDFVLLVYPCMFVDLKAQNLENGYPQIHELIILPITLIALGIQLHHIHQMVVLSISFQS